MNTLMKLMSFKQLYSIKAAFFITAYCSFIVNSWVNNNSIRALADFYIFSTIPLRMMKCLSMDIHAMN